MSLIVLDLDNCISDDAWRIRHIVDDAPDQFLKYHRYHLLAGFDSVCNRHVFDGKKRGVVIVTSRPFFYHAITEEWLLRNRVPFVGLMMRKNGDDRPPVDVKLEQIESIQAAWKAKNGGASIPISCAYDDDPLILAAYDAAGIRSRRLVIHDSDDHRKGVSYE